MNPKNHLTVTGAIPSFAGIMKTINPSVTQAAMNANIPPGQVRLADSKIHMTLAHQSLLKPKAIKAAVKSLISSGVIMPSFTLVLEPVLREGWWRHPTDSGLDEFRSGFAFLVTEDSQKKLATWTKAFLMDAGVRQFEDRQFHVSISNLTGNPGSSLR